MINKFREKYDESLTERLGYVTEMYLDDIENIDKSYATNGENLALGKEIREIVVKLNEMFTLIDKSQFDDSRNTFEALSIYDKVELFREQIHDDRKISIVNNLYKKFLVLRNTMANYNLELVLTVAKNFVEEGDTSIDDVIQIGNMGLLIAIENFNPDKATNFARYAYKVILTEICKFAFWDEFPFELPRTIPLECYRMKKIIYDEYAKRGIIISDLELSKLMNTTLHRVKFLQTLIDISENMCSTDCITDDSYNGLEVSIQKDMKSSVNKVMLDLTLPQKEVLEYRHGFVDGKKYTLEEVAAIRGVKHQAVNTMEHNALKRIRERHPKLRIYLEK